MLQQFQCLKTARVGTNAQPVHLGCSVGHQGPDGFETASTVAKLHAHVLIRTPWGHSHQVTDLVTPRHHLKRGGGWWYQIRAQRAQRQLKYVAMYGWLHRVSNLNQARIQRCVRGAKSAKLQLAASSAANDSACRPSTAVRCRTVTARCRHFLPHKRHSRRPAFSKGAKASHS